MRKEKVMDITLLDVLSERKCGEERVIESREVMYMFVVVPVPVCQQNYHRIYRGTENLIFIPIRLKSDCFSTLRQH